MTAPKLWIVLVRCHHALSQLVERDIAGLGLCITDFAVLEALLHKGPLTITEIQAKVLLASGSMTAAVDRLEKRGLALRKGSQTDRRVRRIELTTEGRSLIQGIFGEHARHLEEAMALLTDEEKRQVYDGLKKLGRSVAARIEGKSQ
jgi:MarR family transcriptional regulator, 2-MHQ and catechol-resistance regulon repressor